MNGAEAIIRTAREAGIEVCFANPGTTELPLVAALDSVGGIRSVLGLTEAKEGLNVTTLICANRGYNILKMEMGRLGVSAPGANALRLTDPGGIGWVALGRGMGVPSARAATAEELASELGRALGEPGPHLIEMVM